MLGEIFSKFSKRTENQLNIDYYEIISTWKSWYRGNVEGFHDYTVTKVDGSIRNCEKKSLQMAKQVCEDMTSMLWNDKTAITIDDQEFLDEILKRNNFQESFVALIEKTMALGTGAIIEYLNDGKVEIDFIEADWLIPLAWNNGNITALATVSQTCISKTYFNHLTLHEYVDGVYTMEHVLFKSADKNELGDPIDLGVLFPELAKSTKVTIEGEVHYMVQYETPQPMFQILKPNLANNIDLQIPLGISIYGNAIDALKAVDNKYDGFDNEFALGIRKVAITTEALKPESTLDADGNLVFKNYFDTNETVFMAVAVDGDSMSSPIIPIDFDIRDQSYINGINQDLNIISYKTGLGNQYYKFDGTGLKTATEVVSENSKLFRNKHKHQEILEVVLTNMVRSILWLTKNELETFSGDPETVEIIITFDDSIIQDKESAKKMALQEVKDGVRSKQSYNEEFRGMTTEESTAELALIANDNKRVLGLPETEVEVDVI